MSAVTISCLFVSDFSCLQLLQTFYTWMKIHKGVSFYEECEMITMSNKTTQQSAQNIPVVNCYFYSTFYTKTAAVYSVRMRWSPSADWCVDLGISEQSLQADFTNWPHAACERKESFFGGRHDNKNMLFWTDRLSKLYDYFVLSQLTHFIHWSLIAETVLWKYSIPKTCTYIQKVSTNAWSSGSVDSPL